MTQPVVKARGERFAGDKPSICMYIERSKNKNVVVYEAVPAASDASKVESIHPYWLDIDPDYVAKNRAKGKQDDAEELNFIEKRMAYGVEVHNPAHAHSHSHSHGHGHSHGAAPASDGKLVATFVALPKRPMSLYTADCRILPPGAAVTDASSLQLMNLPVMETMINGEPCIVQSIYVSSVEGFLGPKVQYVELKGTRLADGTDVVERIEAKAI